jgi:hypothetical protein
MGISPFGGGRGRFSLACFKKQYQFTAWYKKTITPQKIFRQNIWGYCIINYNAIFAPMILNNNSAATGNKALIDACNYVLYRYLQPPSPHYARTVLTDSLSAYTAPGFQPPVQSCRMTTENVIANRSLHIFKQSENDRIETSPCPLQRGIDAHYPPLEGAGGGKIVPVIGRLPQNPNRISNPVRITTETVIAGSTVLVKPFRSNVSCVTTETVIAGLTRNLPLPITIRRLRVKPAMTIRDSGSSTKPPSRVKPATTVRVAVCVRVILNLIQYLQRRSATMAEQINALAVVEGEPSCRDFIRFYLI